jgi:Flp pilus assembly protein CpaB
MFSTRRGAITTAALAALLAGVLLFAFVQSYKKGGTPAVVNTPVFVASQFIPRGTPVSVIASGELMSRTTVPSSHVIAGAIADPSAVKGEVAAADIYPGQQLTATDFTAGSVSLASQLTGINRAIAIPVDSAHGLVGFVHTGDHVDVLESLNNVVSVLAQNITVLNAPSSGGGGVTGGSSSNNIILQVTPRLAVQEAYAADFGKIWVVLRPPVGAIGSTSNSVGTAHK